MEGSGQVKMTSGGRGRGWVMGSGGALRRPGNGTALAVSLQNSSSEPVSPEVEAFLAAVHSIPVHDPSAMKVSLASITNLLQEHFNTQDALKTVMDKLHARSLEDRLFAQKTAAACGILHTLVIDGVKVQKYIMDVLQQDYEDHGRLQTSNGQKFLNTVFFLSEIFKCVQIRGQPIKVLAEPLLKYLMFLLNGDEHEIELFTTCLAVNGKVLQQLCPVLMDDIMKHVRTVVMSRNISGQARCWLLLALDMALRDFAPLPPQLYSFYKVHLSSVALEQLNIASEPATAVAPESPPGSQDKVPSPITPPRECLSPREPLPPPSSPPANAHRRLSSSSSGGEGRTSGNRTAGSGRVSRNWRPEGGQGGAGNARGDWKESGVKNKSWGHDDRFDKADDYYAKPDRRDMAGGAGSRNAANWRTGGGDFKDKNKNEQNSSASQNPAEPENWK